MNAIVSTEADDRYRTISEARIVEMLMMLGWPYEIESGAAEKIAREALGIWVKMGLKFRRAPNGDRLFDPVETCNFHNVCRAKGDSSYSKILTKAGRRLILDLAGPGLFSPKVKGERKFVVDLRRTFNLRSIAPGTKLRLRAPLPLSGEYLQDLAVRPFVEKSSNAQVLVSPGRLEARMVATGESEVILGASLSFTCRLQEPVPGKAGPCPDAALYLSDKEGLIVVTERIRLLAHRLAGTDVPPLEAVRAYWNYLKTEFTSAALHYDEIDLESPCEWVLDSGRFDCQMSATLFVALCRSRGLPARILSGYLLHGLMPTRHYWAEVWLEDRGWTPFDFMGVGTTREEGDPDWVYYFFGRLEYRMTCERLPREFTGALGIPLPSEWGLLQVPKEGGAEINLVDSDGELVYSDTIHVEG